jgi:hypothetical protein
LVICHLSEGPEISISALPANLHDQTHDKLL